MIDIRIYEKLYETLLLYKTIQMCLKHYHEELCDASPIRHHLSNGDSSTKFGTLHYELLFREAIEMPNNNIGFCHASLLCLPELYDKTLWLRCHNYRNFKIVEIFFGYKI